MAQFIDYNAPVTLAGYRKNNKDSRWHKSNQSKQDWHKIIIHTPLGDMYSTAGLGGKQAGGKAIGNLLK